MKKLTQQDKILNLLREHPAGVNSFGLARDIALQLPTRIKELKIKGYQIVSISKPDNSVDYVLQGEPEHEKKIIDWKFEGSNATPIFG